MATLQNTLDGFTDARVAQFQQAYKARAVGKATMIPALTACAKQAESECFALRGKRNEASNPAKDAAFNAALGRLNDAYWQLGFLIQH